MAEHPRDTEGESDDAPTPDPTGSVGPIVVPSFPGVDDDPFGMFSLPPEHDPVAASDDDLQLVWEAPDAEAALDDRGELADDEPPSLTAADRLADRLATPRLSDDLPDADDVAARDAAIDAAWQAEADHRRESFVAELRAASDVDEADPGPVVSDLGELDLGPVASDSSGPDQPAPEREPDPESAPEPDGTAAADDDAVPSGSTAEEAVSEAPETFDAAAFDVGTMTGPVPAGERRLLPGEVDEPEGQIVERYAEAVEVPAGIDHWDEPILRFDDEGDRVAVVEETPGRTRTPWPKPVFIAVVALGAIVCSLVIRSFLVQPYRSPTASMEPTIGVGETFVVNLLSYRLHDVHRGDIVVFDRPEGSDEAASGGQLVKRVIALPGEIVESRDGVVYVDDRALAEPYLDDETPTDGIDRQVVPPGTVFVLGDNRTDSQDSRFFGSIDEDAIAGRAALLVSIPDRITGL